MATMILALVATAAPAALPELPLKSCVLDEAATLRQETLALLQSLCVDLDRGGSGQLVVAVVTNLHGRHDLSDLALELFRHIQIGHLDLTRLRYFRFKFSYAVIFSLKDALRSSLYRMLRS